MGNFDKKLKLIAFQKVLVHLNLHNKYFSE